MMQAHTPASSGVANDVPFAWTYVLSVVVEGSQLRTPRVRRSGLMRRSGVGPRGENEAIRPVLSTPPAVSRLSPFASAGAISVCARGPELPAALTTTIPFAAAISAARVITV